MLLQMSKIRVRYAPSPTGYQHIGGIRTAIMNYLIAKKHDGDFIIRIEDTDRSRYVPEAEKYIIDTLKWLNINIEEGPGIGGTYGPYRQSERCEIYLKYAKDLIHHGKAYYCFESNESLENYRSHSQLESTKFLYNGKSREKLDNSLKLSPEVLNSRLKSESHTIRLKLPLDEVIVFEDSIRGRIEVDSNTLEDKILIKSDGWPTYHLAAVVDDRLMRISHVIRGEEWLPSAPIHHYLYRVFDWEDYKPEFAHLPLILNPDGKGKLSKRRLKNASIPIFPLAWFNSENQLVPGLREEGFLPDAVLNILLALGWSESNDKEIYTRKELYHNFKFSDIQKSGAAFDYKKAIWINSKHIQNSSDDFIFNYSIQFFKEKLHEFDLDKLRLTIKHLKNRFKTIKDLLEFEVLFSKKYNKNTSEDKNDHDFQYLVDEFHSRLLSVKIWEKDSLDEIIEDVIQDLDFRPKKAHVTLRKALTGMAKGPDNVLIMLILGKETTINRIKNENRDY